MQNEIRNFLECLCRIDHTVCDTSVEPPAIGGTTLDNIDRIAVRAETAADLPEISGPRFTG